MQGTTESPITPVKSSAKLDRVSALTSRTLWGLLLAIAAFAVFYFQISWAMRLITPWYLPVAGTLAAGLLLWDFFRRPRLVFGCLTLLFALLACMEWMFVASGSVLPAYRGPVSEGSAFPRFHATLADGTEVSETYFKQNPMTAVVFFQGRWCPFCVTQLRDLEAHHADLSRAGGKVLVVSMETLNLAKRSQQDFPHLLVASDERRELSTALDLINRGFAPGGVDCPTPTMLLVDREGRVRWFHRPARFLSRPSAKELATLIASRKSE